jgi:hypothetical protein
MGRSVSAVAARAVKNSEKGSKPAKRTGEERLSAIRSSVPAKLHVPIGEVGFLLELHDALVVFIKDVVNPALEQTRHERDAFAHQLFESQSDFSTFRCVSLTKIDELAASHAIALQSANQEIDTLKAQLAGSGDGPNAEG